MVFGINTAKNTQTQPNKTEAKTAIPQNATTTTSSQPLNPEQKSQLHSAEPSPTNPGKTDSIKFRKIMPGDPWLRNNPEAAKIIKRFQVGVREENTAVLDEKENKLVIISNGPTAHKQLFNNGIIYKSIGWLGRLILRKPDKDIVGKWDKSEIKYSKSEADPQAKVLEPLKHIRKALRADEYKVVSIFTRNGKPNNRFNKYPSAVALIDSYSHLIDQAAKYAPKAQAKAAQAAKEKGVDFEGSYATDQYLGNPESHLELNDITHTVAEAFYQGHGYDSLTVHYKVHSDPFMESDDLAYHSIPWKHIYQRQDGQWKTSDDTHPSSKVTIIKPKDKAKLQMNPELAYVHAWSQMSEGKKFHRDVKNLELALQAEEKNSKHISDLNRLLGYND